MTIAHDRYGNEHDIKSYAYSGTVLILGTGEWDAPIVSLVVRDSGEIRGLWGEPDFRGGHEFPKLVMLMIQDAYRNGVIPVTSGRITGYIHPDNVRSVGVCRGQGAPIEVKDINGKKYAVVDWAIEDFMNVVP